jgi:hypothetical protein
MYHDERPLMAESPVPALTRKPAAYGDLIDLYAARAARARTLSLGADPVVRVVPVGRGAVTATVRERLAPAQPSLRRFRVAIAGASVALFGVAFAAGALAAPPVHMGTAQAHAGIVRTIDPGR